jgi:hypothetical protein
VLCEGGVVSKNGNKGGVVSKNGNKGGGST